MPDHADRLVEVLAELRLGLSQTRRVLARIDERAEQLATACRGRSLVREVLVEEPEARLVQLLSEALELLQQHGAQVRQTEAQLLYAEGLTMDEIGELFGVTRQRVGTLIRAGRSTALAKQSERTLWQSVA